MTHAQEEAYFAKLNAERRAELRTQLNIRARELNQERALQTVLRIEDEVLIKRIRALGFDGDSVRVLDLLPLIWVCWADGRIQRGERATVLSILERRGLSYDSEAFLLIEALLEERPSESYLEEALIVLKALREKQGSSEKDIVSLCFAVADASSNLLSLSAIGREERLTLERVAAVLGNDAIRELERRLE